MNSQVITNLNWRANRLALFVWIVSVGFSIIGLTLLFQSAVISIPTRWGPRGFSAFFTMIFSSMGLLISSFHRENRIGQLFLFGGFVGGLQVFTEEYATYALLFKPGSLPFAQFVAWVQNFIWIPGAIPIWLFTILLFPSGELPSPRWKPLAWTAILAIVGLSFAIAFTPGELQNLPTIQNPAGLVQWSDELNLLTYGCYFLIMVIVLAGVISLFRRLRQSQNIERQQLKWFSYAAALLGLTIPFGFTGNPWSELMIIIATCAIPLSVAIAILRYRLWDIDILIRRTLIYGLLTAILALIYFAGIVILQFALRALTGQQQSEIITVLSTLAIGALFAPVRRRVQNAIDRAFYRKKYDAARVIAQFAQTARDEVELSKLSERLVGVVRETMQPASVSLWLRKR